MDDSLAVRVRGSSSTLPRGYLWLVPVWFAVAAALLWREWSRLGPAMPRWYGGMLLGALVITVVTFVSVLRTVRHLAFRADANGIRLGIRTDRKRPRQRQIHLWWSDVQTVNIMPRRYGALVEITLAPAARIARRRSLWRQAVLMCGMLVMPVFLGRGTPRLTEPRSRAPQYRVRLCDVTPAEMGVALASFALPEVEIVVLSRWRLPLLARRPASATPATPTAA